MTWSEHGDYTSLTENQNGLRDADSRKYRVKGAGTTGRSSWALWFFHVIHTHTHIHTCIHTYVHTRCIHIYTYHNTYIYANIRTCIHAQTWTAKELPHGFVERSLCTSWVRCYDRHAHDSIFTHMYACLQGKVSTQAYICIQSTDAYNRNILVDSKFVAKVADFGLCTNESVSVRGAGTPRWAAPEVLECMPEIGEGASPKPYDKRCDYYRWACVSFDCCRLACMPFAWFMVYAFGRINTSSICICIYIYIYIHTYIHTHT